MADQQTAPGLRVTAKKAGFRRAGRAWNVEPTDVLLADLTDDQIEALKGETALVVEEIDIEVEESADSKPAAPANSKPATPAKKK